MALKPIYVRGSKCNRMRKTRLSSISVVQRRNVLDLYGQYDLLKWTTKVIRCKNDDRPRDARVWPVACCLETVIQVTQADILARELEQLYSLGFEHPR